jgi:hypothetical protein
MITDNTWSNLAKKAFPMRAVKAPPFLWTRILAGIAAEETRRASLWWLQWRWMERVTVAVGLLVGVSAFYLFAGSAMPLDMALEGHSEQHQGIMLASTDMPTADDSVILVVGSDS